jgi:uncharacterized protein (TIGR02594 family)
MYNFNLPKDFMWINEFHLLPRMLEEGLMEMGCRETLGVKNNPIIIGWAKEIGGKVENVYKADSIPWCGLFMGVCAHRAGWKLPKDPLWALNWGSFGDYAEDPKFGDVLVFIRNGGGHVGMYIGETPTTYWVYGGNQSDEVGFAQLAKNRLYTSRQPNWKRFPPQSRRKHYLDIDGAISTNEA